MLAEKLPDKLYFSIKEVSTLCAEKASVLRYWEKEFCQLCPQKKHQQRRYQKKDIEIILSIKTLLRDEKMTIEGAKLQLNEPEKKLLRENSKVKIHQITNIDNKNKAYQDKNFEDKTCCKKDLLALKNTLQDLLNSL